MDPARLRRKRRARLNRWIVHTARTLTEEVPAAPTEVRDYYVDLDNIKQVHPLVISVRTITRSDTADGYVQSYRVTDRIPMKLFALRISYRARLQVPVDGDVVTEARQFPHVRLDGTVSFEAVGTGTRIVERLQIAAPRPLAGLTARQAVTAHVAMLAGIRHRFQSGATQ